MKYISQINAFWRWARINELPSRAGYLYFAILDCANAAGWKDEFNAPNLTLQAMAGLDKNGLVRYRNNLIQAGLITYKQGKRGTAGIYGIIPLYDTNVDTNVDTNNEPIMIPITNPNREHTKSKSKSKNEIITPLSPKGDIPLKGDTHTKFKQPTIDEVRAYCSERHNNVNPQTFVDFYASKGWKVGNQPMRDWKACVRTWEQKDKGKPNRQRDMANTRSYSDLDAVGNDLLGG